jgi:hypothetical protein
VSPGTVGNVLTSNGTAWVSQAAGSSLIGDTDTATPFETSLGSGAGTSVTGVNNTLIGFNAGNAVSTGTDNAYVGFEAGKLTTTGQYNVAIGSAALDATTTGFGQTAVGASALSASTGAFAIQTAVGAFSLQAATTGAYNVALGYGSLQGLTTASDNVAVGSFAASSAINSGYAVTGNKNTVVGNYAYGGFQGDFLMSGIENVSIGYSSMQKQNNADYCVAVGTYALGTGNDLQGDFNTAVGYTAGDGVTTGTQNTIIGAAAASSGTNDLTTGSNNTVIGYNAATSSATVSNTITLGNSSITTLRCQVTTITSLSDGRDKTNVNSLSAGLSFVDALRPVAFDWNMRDGGKVGEPDTGFIAQELQSAQQLLGVHIPGLVNEDNPDMLEAGYGKLIPVLVKAIQELSAEVKALKQAV